MFLLARLATYGYVRCELSSTYMHALSSTSPSIFTLLLSHYLSHSLLPPLPFPSQSLLCPRNPPTCCFPSLSSFRFPLLFTPFHSLTCPSPFLSIVSSLLSLALLSPSHLHRIHGRVEYRWRGCDAITQEPVSTL